MLDLAGLQVLVLGQDAVRVLDVDAEHPFDQIERVGAGARLRTHLYQPRPYVLRPAGDRHRACRLQRSVQENAIARHRPFDLFARRTVVQHPRAGEFEVRESPTAQCRGRH